MQCHDQWRHAYNVACSYGLQKSSDQKSRLRAINKARMRCFVKAIAMHGLGLYIYQGEDLPEAPEEKAKEKEA